MKRGIAKGVLGVVLSIVIAFPGYAQAVSKDHAPEDVTGITYSVIQTEHASKMAGAARGRVISSGAVGLTDKGKGIFSVYADTSCHSAVKNIYMTVYLDIWNDSTQDWDTINSFDYEWHAKTPEEDLHSVVVSFEIHDLTRGREYQLRGNHMAEAFDGVFEAMSTQTQTLTLS